MPLSFAPVTALVDALVAAGVRATLNPADLNLPAAWVNVETIRALTVDGSLQLEVAVYLIAPDGDYTVAYDTLAELYNATATVLSPDGPVTPQGVVLPGTSTALPALRVPVNLT